MSISETFRPSSRKPLAGFPAGLDDRAQSRVVITALRATRTRSARRSCAPSPRRSLHQTWGQGQNRPCHTVLYHPVQSYPYPMLSVLTPPCPTPCYATPRHATPCRAVQCHAVPCHSMPRYATLRNATQRNAALCYVRLCHAMPCHAMPCHAMLCYAMLRYATLRYATLHYAMLWRQRKPGGRQRMHFEACP